jgi:hypothetical protein
MQPLALAGNSPFQTNTSLSTSISLSVLDENRNAISINASYDHPIELIIPRDVNVAVPLMIRQNVTSVNDSDHTMPFKLHLVNMTQAQINTNLTVSLHIEISPLSTTIGYMLIYRFDNPPQLDSSINRIDGWFLLCRSSQFVFSFRF